MNWGEEKLADLLGDELEVPIWSGGTTRYVNLDNAATTPPLKEVWECLQKIMPWYGSIQRGAGLKSRVSTKIYEDALQIIHTFCEASPDDVVIFGQNTTTCINQLARRMNLSTESVVVTSAMEHTSNTLPWRRSAKVIECNPSIDGTPDLNHLEQILKQNRVRLIAVTAASNITGAIADVQSISSIAHSYGAEVFVDAAQLVAHRPIERGSSQSLAHIDYLAFASHKMYAPFGIGVLVGKRKVFETGWPDNAGGGTVRLLDGEDIFWMDLPARETGGTPNFPGIAALAVACKRLKEIGFGNILKHEAALNENAFRILGSIPKVSLYSINSAISKNNTAVFPFSVEGFHHSLVSAYLGTECGIGVRSGPICQFGFVRRLLGIPDNDWSRMRSDILSGDNRRMYGIVRASCGLGTTILDIEALGQSLSRLVEKGIKAIYEQNADGEFLPKDWRYPVSLF